jgi:dihydroorotase
MKILIQNARVIDPASGFDQLGALAIAAGRIVGLGRAPEGFVPNQVVDAKGCIAMPGLVDLHASLREPGHEQEGMLESEMAAAAAGGVTSVVCPPDTDPVLDEPGLVQTLKLRAEKLRGARLFPLGALTLGLKGEALSEMGQLTRSGCVGFSQAQRPIVNTQVLLRACQYAATYDYTVWLRALDPWLGKGVAASGALAMRMGLSGVPVVAETIALHTIFDVARATGAHIHVGKISSAAGVTLLRAAKAEGLNISASVSMNSLHLTDVDMGYFDSNARLDPPLRQQADRQALSQALADGGIDALVSDHVPVLADAKALPFAEAEAGATGLELLLSLALKWQQDSGVDLRRALAVVSCEPVRVLGAAMGSLSSSLGQLVEGGVADVCLFDPVATRIVGRAQQGGAQAAAFVSQGKHTPFDGYELPGVVRATWVGGHLAHQRNLSMVTLGH